MSWIVSPSSAVGGSSAALNGTSKPDSYKTQKGWELTKNMAYVGPANQLYQQDFDLDPFLSPDNYRGGYYSLLRHHRNGYSGFKLATSAALPTVTLPASSLGSVASTIKVYGNQDFIRTETESYSEQFWQFTPTYTYTKTGSITTEGLHLIVSNSAVSGSITVKCLGDTDEEDHGYAIFVNGACVADSDADSDATISAPFEAGATVYIKASHYNYRTSFNTDGCYGNRLDASGDSDYCNYSITSQFVGATVYFDKYQSASGDWTYHPSGTSGHHAMLVWHSSTGQTITPRYNDRVGTNCDMIIAYYVNGKYHSHYNNDGADGAQGPTITVAAYDTVVAVNTYNHTPAASLIDELHNMVKHEAEVKAQLDIGNITSYSHPGASSYAFKSLSTSPTSSVTITESATATRVYNREVLSATRNVARAIPRKINRLPSSVAPRKRKSDVIFGNYAAPNGDVLYDSFYFVAAQAGTVSGRCRGGTGGNYSSWNSNTPSDGEWKVYINGVNNYTYDDEGTFSFSVSEGDTVSFKRVYHGQNSTSIPANEREYVSCTFTGEYAENYYVPVGGETEWVSYASSRNEVISTNGPDYTFTAASSGILSISFFDNTSSIGASSADSFVSIFLNGIYQSEKYLDADNRTDSRTLSLAAGDVVVIRPCRYGLSNKSSYIVVDKMDAMELPTGTLNFSFSGSAVSGISQSYTLNWKQYIASIIVEAKLWALRENLTDYAFPLYIDDTSDNQSRLDDISKMIDDALLMTDIFCVLDSGSTFKVPKYTRYLALFDSYSGGQRFTSTSHPYLEEISYSLRATKNANLKNFAKGSTLKVAYIDTAMDSGYVTVDNGFADCPNLIYGYINGGRGSAKELFLNSPIEKVHIHGMGYLELDRVCYNNQHLIQIEELHNSSHGSLISAFENCVNVTGKVPIDGKFSDMSRAFYNCYNIEAFDTSCFYNFMSGDYTFYNCYKCNLVQSHDTIKAILDKCNSPTYDDWVSGKNRTTFFNCPHNGTILEDIMSYDEQKAVGFKPEKLMYEALKANINSNDAGYRNIHHEDSPWSEYVSDFITYAKPHTIKAVSHQLDESSAAAYLEVDGKIVQTFGNRGHLIGVYDCKTMSIKYYDWTDTYAYQTKTTPVESIWANALSIAGPTDIIYVLSFDATTRSDSARNSCLSVGGRTGYGTWGATRYAHALIGKVGLGANNGYESINNGGSASVVEAKFTSDGLVCSTWMDSGKNHLYEPDNSFTYEHPREFYKVEVPAEEYWRWKYLLKNMKSLWDSCSFTFTDTNTADFTLSVKTTGADAEVNPNSSLSINYELKNYSSPDFYWHIGKIENVSDKDVSIKRIFANTKNIHCVECDFINIDDISYAFYQCGQIDHIIAKMHGCTIAQYTFAECANIKTIEAVSDTITDAQFMCYNCPELVTYDLTGMTALKDATSMFEKCPSFSTEQFKQNTKLPDCLEIAKRMFAECSITEIEGNWVPRNASSSFQNYTEISHGVQEKDWENRLEKDGWSFPSHLYSAYQMFEGNPIKKISYLKLNEKADNSWLFQNCSELTTIDFSYLNVDAYDNGKYTGIFDGCSLKKDNVIWLPISIGSDFDLAQTGIKYGKNEAPTLFWVDDYWCEVDHSGFVEYQHIRRPAYEKVYKEHYGDILIKFWSHPHVHSAEMRGYNELHDTTVWYDKDSYGHGIYPTSWVDN